MPKISRNNIGEYNKSCSAQHQESIKIEFAFFQIFYDFLEILQDSALCIHYWRYILHRGPYKDLKCYNYTPGL
jgi:hypothetical protein